jgi:paraquat-inducible protein B
MIMGGIAFGLPKGVDPGEKVEEHFLYYLYPTQTKADRQRSYESTRYTLYFSDSVRGLAVGAPVEFSGIRIGEVLSIDAEYDTETLDIRIPVVIEIERGIFRPVGGSSTQSKDDAAVLAKLIENGLRATLKSENLLTGAQFVDLVIMPNAKEQKDVKGMIPKNAVIPTVPSGLNLLQQRIDTVFARLDALPIEQIGNKLDKSLEELQQALVKLNAVLEPFGKKAEPISVQVENALKRTSGAMRSMDKAVAPNSQLQTQLLQTLNDFSGASRAIRDLARYLERNPQSLLLGKPGR